MHSVKLILGALNRFQWEGSMKKMNKKSSLVLLLVAMVLLSSITFSAGIGKVISATQREDFKLTLNGNSKTLKSTTNQVIHPIVVDGVTYLPLRAIAELANMEVKWLASTSTIALTQSLEANANSYIAKIEQLSREKDTLQAQVRDLETRLGNYEGTKATQDYKKVPFKINYPQYNAREIFKTFTNYWGANKPFTNNGKVYSGSEVIGVSCTGNVTLWSNTNYTYYVQAKFENPGGLYSEMYFYTIADDSLSSSKIRGSLLAKTLSGTYKWLKEDDYTAENGKLTFDVSNYSEVSYIMLPVISDPSIRMSGNVDANGYITSYPSSKATTSEGLVLLVGPYAK